MNITRYEDEGLFSALRDEWNDLVVDSEANQIFLTLEWQESWWQAYQPGVIWALAVRDQQSGQLVGIAPWFMRPEPSAQRILRTIGCVDVTDYLEIVARRGREEAVYAALAAYVNEHASCFDEIRLCNVPEDSLTQRVMPGFFERAGFEVKLDLQEVCPIIQLPSQWEEYLAMLNKKYRHDLRRKLRRASEASDTVGWYVVGPEHDLETELDRFLCLMEASTPEKRAFLEEPGNRAFFRLIVPRAAAKGWLQLAFSTVNGEAAAAYLNFDYHNRVVVYNSGLNPAAYTHLSMGILLLAWLIEDAIKRGREVFDFLRGNEHYKYRMGGQDTRVFQIRIGRGLSSPTAEPASL